MKKTFHIISLGCAKNTVDADDMAQLLIAAGYKPLIDRNRAQVDLLPRHVRNPTKP